MGEEYNLAKGVFYRFLRGFVAGAVASMASMVPFMGNGDWKALYTWLSLLCFAGVAGGITGGILALDKYIRETKQTNKPNV